MKQKLKKLTKIGILLFGISFFLTNCEQDSVEHSNRQAPENPAFKTSKVTKSTIQQNQTLTKAIQSLEKELVKTKSNTQNKTVYSSEYDFTIETDFATYIENEDGTYHSYTFPIIRTISNGLLENLLLSLQEDGTYKTYIVSYDLTEQEREDISNEIQINLENRATFNEIDGTNLTSDIFSNKMYACGYNFEVVCWETACEIDGCWDSQYTNTECDSILIYVDCSGGGGGGSGTGTGDGGNTTGNTGSGGYGGGGGSGSGSTNPDVTTPTIPQPWEEVVLCLNGLSINGSTNGFTPEMSAWLQSQPKNVVGQINNYIDQNECSETAQDFAIQAIIALMDGGEVDFEEELILDSDLKDNDCLYSVYTGMGNAPTFTNYLNNFDGDMSVANLKLTSSTTLPSNTNAETSAPQNYLITITFNENNLNRPNLSIARTFIHEMIHAEIFRKLLSVAQHPSIQLDQNQLIQLRNDYPGLYDYYMRWKWNVPQGQSPSSAQHEAMAQHYRDIIKQALEEFDNTHTDEIYEALAWTGLQNTVAWNNLSQSERDNISQTIANFNSNNPNCQ